MSSATPPGPAAAEVVAALAAMPVDVRAGTLDHFFRTWTGVDRPDAGIGLGAAVVAFWEWERASGRIADDGSGSTWWAAVNGALVADLASAAERLGRPVPATDTTAHGPLPAALTDSADRVQAWVDFATATPDRAQAALWHAHQCSIDAGVELATDLLELEDKPEQDFARLALAVVDRAAHDGVPTDDPFLGEVTRRTYPATYPVDEQGLARVYEALTAARRASAPDVSARSD